MSKPLPKKALTVHYIRDDGVATLCGEVRTKDSTGPTWVLLTHKSVDEKKVDCLICKRIATQKAPM